MAGPKITRKMRRDLHADGSTALPNLARHLVGVLNFTDDAKRFRVYEAIEELPALDGAILVQDHHRHVLHVIIERITERDHLDERRKKHEEQRHRIAQDRDEFLEQDRVQSAERRALHAAFSCCFSPACFAVRVTKTSSSDGPISWISGLSI